MEADDGDHEARERWQLVDWSLQNHGLRAPRDPVRGIWMRIAGRIRLISPDSVDSVTMPQTSL